MVSQEDIKKIFTKFGNLMIPISILSFIGFIWTLLYWLTPQNIIVIYTTGVIIGISLFIFFVLVFIEIHKAGKLLNNSHLKNFVPKLIIGTILKGFGDILIVMFISAFLGGDRYTFVHTFANSFLHTIAGGNFFLGLLIVLFSIIGGSILRAYAWKDLKEFFETNYKFFPLDFGDFGQSGAKVCKGASRVEIFILPIFNIIANIVRLIGYSKFIKLRGLERSPSQLQIESKVPISTFRTTSTKNFCTNCGSAITPGTRFCQQCGSEIK